jgi:dynein heavy chain, axonemal
VKKVLEASTVLKVKEPDAQEELLLMRVLKDANVSKLVDHDIPIFYSIMNDVFPGIKALAIENHRLSQALEKSLQSMHLQKSALFLTKAQQIHDAQANQNSIIVVGESGSGKSTIIRSLGLAYGYMKESSEGSIDASNMYDHVHISVVYPATLSIYELYGGYHLSTEWRDGLISKILRESINAQMHKSTRKRWIVFDGSIESEWVDYLNSVVDDSRLLCLLSSERIQVPSTVSILFEIHDISRASPAIVSRCGVVYVEESQIDMLALVRHWGMNTLPKYVSRQSAKVLISTIEANIEVTVSFVHSECNEVTKTSSNHLVQSFLHLFEAKLLEYLSIDPLNPSKSSSIDSDSFVQDIDLMNATVLWCLIWSVAANLDDHSRSVFHEWCRSRFSTTISSKYMMLLQDPFGTCLDLVAKEIKTWASMIPAMPSDSNLSYSEIFVPTIDTTRYSYVLRKLCINHNHVMLVGDSCVGKTMIANSFLTEMMSQKSAIVHAMHQSFATKDRLRSVLENKLERKRKVLLAPAVGKKFYLFIDDINMNTEKSDRTINEFVRELLDSNGFYDREKLYFKSVEDVICLSTMNPSRAALNPRLLRRYFTMAMPSMAKENTMKIFSSLSELYTTKSLSEHLESVQNILRESSMRVHELLSSYSKHSSMSKYRFSLRDISNAFDSLLHLSRPTNQRDALQSWLHETKRTICDRIVDIVDRQTTSLALTSSLKICIEHFGDDEAKAINVDEESFKDSTFGSLSKIPINLTDFQYIETESLPLVEKELDRCLDELKQQGLVEQNIVLFPDFVQHILRVARIIAQPKGHGLLLCKDGGVGRKSVLRIVSGLFNCSLLSFNSLASADYNSFRTSLSENLIKVITNTQPSVLAINDTQIIDTRILDDIYLLAAGENIADYLPRLSDEEFEKMSAALKASAKTINRDLDSTETIKSYMVEVLVQRLHIVICSSASNLNRFNRYSVKIFERFRSDWFDFWPKDALQLIANQRITSAAKSSGNTTTATASSSLVPNVSLGVEPFLDQLAIIFHQVFQSAEKVASKHDATSQQGTDVRFISTLTPSSYLEFINVYITLLQQQRDKLTGRELRYRLGLKKMQETDAFVKNLEQNLVKLQPVLEESSNETALLLQQVSQDILTADNQAKVVDAEVFKMNDEAVEVESIKNACQAELNLVLPQYEAAVKALETLDKKALQELKAFNNPPDLVKFTLEAVCILFDKPPSWDEAKKLLSLMDFMDRLMLFDKDNIQAKIVSKLDKYYNDERFVPDEVKKQSTAAMCLCMWVRSMVEYFQVAKTIEPKREALRRAEAKLNKTKSDLESMNVSLGLIKRKIDETNETLRATETKKAAIELQLENTQVQLVRASSIIDGLEIEKRRWEKSADLLRVQSTNLIGDMVIAAGMISLLSATSKPSRSSIIQEWRQICRDQGVSTSEEISMVDSILDNQVALQSWSQNGLPSDPESRENGFIVLYVSSKNHRWPFIVDPHGIANRWLRGIFAKDNIQVVKASESSEAVMKIIDNSIRNGYPLLIDDIRGKLNPLIEDLLQKVMIFTSSNPTQGRRGSTQSAATVPNVVKIRIGDNEIPYNNDFKLFLLTRELHPTLTTDSLDRLTVINFSITSKGFEEQLLDDLIRFEKPELHEKQRKVQLSLSEDHKTLEELEAQILTLVSSSNANILENEELTSALEKSKISSSALVSRIKEAEVTNEEILIVREGYRNIATRAAVLYQVLFSASSINAMYMFSLTQFKDNFHKTLERTEKKDNPRARAAIVIPALTKNIYDIGSRGMMNSDKLLFALMMASSIQFASGTLSAAEWEVFVHGITLPSVLPNFQAKPVAGIAPSSLLSPSGLTSPSTNLVISSPTGRSVALSKRPFPAILAQIGQTNPNFPINEVLWSKCVVLEASLHFFEGLCGDIMGKSSAWALYLESDSFLAQRLPGAWETKLNEFQKLLLLRVLREDYIISSVKRYVVSVLGESFLERSALNLNTIINESDNKTPIIFYLSAGMDPTGALIQLAREQGIYDAEAAVSDAPTSNAGLGFGGLKIVSLGQGQEQLAEKAIELCQKAGYWLCLENCNLAPAWMPRLEQTIGRTMVLSDAVGELPLSPKASDSVHANFRLWLTTTHSLTFPANIIRRSTLLTSEAPRGMRALMLQVLTSFTDEEYSSCCGCSNQKIWRKIFFALAYFHAQISERRNYTSIGWRDNYDWILNDFHIAMEIVKASIDDYSEQLRKQMQQQLLAKAAASANPDEERDEISTPGIPETPLLSPHGVALPPQSIVSPFSWDGLVNAITDGAYCGRIKNQDDKMTLTALLRRVLQPLLLDNPTFPLSDGELYVMPSEDRTRQAIIDHVKAYPIDDIPSALQLPASAAVAMMRIESLDLIKKVSKDHRIVDAAVDVSFDKKFQAKIEAITSRIAHTLDISTAHAKSFESHGNTLLPLSLVLSQEIADYNKLMETIHRSCADLLAAAFEKIASDEELDAMRKSLQSNKVPLQWQRVACHGFDDLDRWIDDLVDRLAFINAWITTGPPKVYSLAGLFDPRRFLLALKQTYAREMKAPIESLLMTCEMTPLSAKDVRTYPLDGTYLCGLRLVNGKFNRHSKVLDDGGASSLESMPCILIRFTVNNTSANDKTYMCPLYQGARANRLASAENCLDNFIISLPIPCSKDEQHWRRRGCVMITSSEE